MSLLSNIFKSGGQSAVKSATVFAANHFPEITSNAQLMTFGDQVKQQAMQLETLRSRMNDDKTDLDTAQANVDRYQGAGKKLLEQKASAKPEDVAGIEAGISEAVSALKKFTSIRDDAKTRYDETCQDFAAKEKDLEQASNYYATMKQKLDDLARERERLDDDAQRQKTRLREADKKVGIGISSDTAILDAMQSQNAKKRTEVAGMKTAADSINKAVEGPAPSAALAEALKDSSAPAQSQDDELKALLGK